MGSASREFLRRRLTTQTSRWLVGEGWKERVDPEKPSVPPNRRVITTVKGKNIGYGATCECMVQAGLVILQETSKLPSMGGVYPPGYAFADTTLVKRLNDREVTFSNVVEDI